VNIPTNIDGGQACLDATPDRAVSDGRSGKLPEKQTSFSILVVEDNTLFRDLLNDVLKLRFPSLTLATVATGSEALAQIDLIRPDLIFMDPRLPGEDGFELVRRFQQAAAKAIVILFSGIDFLEYRGEALCCCADHYLGIGKTDNRDIVDLVESIVASRIVF
jgi:CheY-like chemotaxis protein